MNTLEQTRTTVIYRSDVRPDIRTTEPAYAPAIAWADAHPHVWRIVTGSRSRAFGLGSSEYIGWAQRSMEPDAILERARHFAGLLERPGQWSAANSIFTWRARFTLDHYQAKGFTGGFFQQHDDRYPRSCLVLDYTPETLPDVLDRFCVWMDRYFETTRVTVNGLTVRAFPGKER